MPWPPTSGRGSWPATTSEPVNITWRRLFEETARVLGERPAARWLCETACGLDGDDFIAALDEPATERMVAHLDAMVARHRSGEPLAYVMGRWSFRHIELMIDRRVLIPRPETELVAGRAIELARGVHHGGEVARRVLDLGTGSGAIGLSMAHELPISGTEVWLTDASVDALDVARANAAGLGRVAANVRFAGGDWFDALPIGLKGGFDVIVSNPPYIATGDPEVELSVVEHEPHGALFAGDDGLDAVRRIVSEVFDWLTPGGWLVVEVGYRQTEMVRGLMMEAGFEPSHIHIHHDLTPHPRFISAQSGALGTRGRG